MERAGTNLATMQCHSSHSDNSQSNERHGGQFKWLDLFISGLTP